MKFLIDNLLWFHSSSTGDQQGYNIPQITHLKDLRSWVDPKNVESSEKKQLPELMTRLLGDAYICMYSNTEERKLTYV